MAGPARATQRWVKQRLEVNNVSWTPLVPPLDFDYFAFRCDTSALTYRTTVEDASTEDSTQQYVQDGVAGGFFVKFNSVPEEYVFNRFTAGMPVAWFKSASPSATMIITWVL